MKNTRNRSQKETETTKFEGRNKINNIKKIHPLGKFGDTGSSIDQELGKSEILEYNENYGLGKNQILNNPHSNLNIYNPTASSKIRNMQNLKKSENNSLILENSRIKINMASLKKFHLK